MSIDTRRPKLILETNVCRNSSLTSSPRTSRYTQDFIELGKLGKGGYGTIYTIINKLDGARYALKKIDYTETVNRALPPSVQLLDKQTKQRRILREVLLLASLNHPNICRYYQAWIEEKVDKPLHKQLEYTAAELSQDSTTASRNQDDMSIEFERSNEQPVHDTPEPSPKIKYCRKSFILYIQMQLYEKTLRDWLDTPGHELNLRENMNIFRQITEGLDYIHSRGIVHRDLKPENIFLSQAPNGSTTVCIGDFGLATTTTELEEEGNRCPQGECAAHPTHGVGTLTYASPEQQRCHKCNEKTDIYSLGLILFELLTKFNTKMERAIVMKELRLFIFPPTFIQQYPQHTALVMRLMSLAPEHRPSASEVLNTEILYAYEPCVSTPKKDLEETRLKLKRQEEIIQQQEATIQKLCLLNETVNQLSLSPRKPFKRRLWDDKENLENAGSPLPVSALKSQRAQPSPFVTYCVK